MRKERKVAMTDLENKTTETDSQKNVSLAMAVRNVDKNLRYDPTVTYFTKAETDKLLIWAYEQGASDINIETGKPIILDIGNKYFVTHDLKPQEVEDMSQKIADKDVWAKILRGEDFDASYQIKTDEPLKDGSFSIRFRVNISQSIAKDGAKGMQITLRTMSETPPHISAMNLEEDILKRISPSQGAIWVTGSTGSGKSTLLASIIRMILEKEDSHKKILTYEAPAEYLYHKIKGKSSFVSQMEIGDAGGLPTFGAAIRNALRRAPDVILLGEARDKESIQGAITAAQTGHLLYTTTHTNGFVEIIPRLLDAFDKEQQEQKCSDIISSTQMCISQRLVNRKGGGRIALREYVIFNEVIKKELVKGGASKVSQNARKVLRKYGQSFSQDAIKKFERGEIEESTLLEVLDDYGEMDRDGNYIEDKHLESDDLVGNLEQAILLQQKQISLLTEMLSKSFEKQEKLLNYIQKREDMQLFDIADGEIKDEDPDF